MQDKTSKVNDVLIVELIEIVRKCLNFAALDCKLTYLHPSDWQAKYLQLTCLSKRRIFKNVIPNWKIIPDSLLGK